LSKAGFWTVDGNLNTDNDMYLGTLDANTNLNFIVGGNVAGFIQGHFDSACVALGTESLTANTGQYNTGVGAKTLFNNTSGYENTALGYQANFTSTTGGRNTIIGTISDVLADDDSLATAVGFGAFSSTGGIALGFGASNAEPYEFSIGIQTHLNFPLNTHAAGAFLVDSAVGFGIWNVPEINTTAGDGATIDRISGRFRKDNSGSTFTLTNSFITANSIILLQVITAGLTTGNEVVVSAGAGSATITFQTSLAGAAAPSATCDVNFFIIN